MDVCIVNHETCLNQKKKGKTIHFSFPQESPQSCPDDFTWPTPEWRGSRNPSALSGEAWFSCVLPLSGRCCRWQDTWLGRVSPSDEVTEKRCGKCKAFRLGIWAGELGNVAREKGDCLSCQYRSVCWGSFRTSVSAILTLSWTHSEHR